MKLKNIIYTIIISIVFPVSIFSQKYVPDTASFNQTDKLLTQETFVTTFSFQTTNSGTSYDLDSSLNFMYIKDSILTLQISDLGGNSALGFEGKINDFTVKC
jgi:hypothetical protein